MKPKKMFRHPSGAVFLLPARDVPASHDASAATLAVLGPAVTYHGTLTTPEGRRTVYVIDGQRNDSMAVASLMWRYGFRGTLMATPFGLWLVYPQAPGLLRGMRLHTKQPWRVSYGLVDCDLPR